MSQISVSPSHKKQASWKVSDQTKVPNKEASVIGASFRLPERFSPSKSGLNQSRLFNTSMQKMKLSKISGQKDMPLTPKKDKLTFGLNQGSSILKEQKQFAKETPKKQIKQHAVDINRKDSTYSISQDNLKTIRHEMMKNLIQQYEMNRRMILQVKDEVNRFKVLILEQINIQRSVVSQFMKKIEDYLQKNNSGVAMGLKDIIESQNSAVQTMASQLKYFSNIQKNVKKQEQLSGGILPLNEGSPKVDIAKTTNTKQVSELLASSKKIKNQPAPILPAQVLQDPSHQKEITNQASSKRGSPHLQKCNHIVQTITILNEINDCPIKSLNNNASTKSVQKIAIEEYKQRIMAITKSNDNLIREKSRQKTAINEEQLKVKGNFKLQKFYNAIQKLKQQVKQIKNINDMKQTRPTRIPKNS